MLITFKALFPLFVVVMPREPRPPVLLVGLLIRKVAVSIYRTIPPGKKKKALRRRNSVKYTRLCFLAKMLRHDKVLQIHRARKVGQGLLTSLQVMPSLFGEWYLDYYCTCHCEQIPRWYAFPPSHHLNPALHSDSSVASHKEGDI